MKNPMAVLTVALPMFLYSCSMDSVIENVSGQGDGPVRSMAVGPGRTAGAEDILDNGWPMESFSRCSFEIRNEEPSLHLEVYGISINNLYLGGTVSVDDAGGYVWSALTEKGETLIPVEKTAVSCGKSVQVGFDGYFIPQKVQPWAATVHPEMQAGAYIWLDCIIYNICDTQAGYREGFDVPVWSDGNGGSRKVAVPVSLDLKAGQTQEIVLTLAGGQPWYNVDDDVPSPVLTPIMFDVTVDGWGSVENDIDF